jgi:hypothetical protein
MDMAPVVDAKLHMDRNIVYKMNNEKQKCVRKWRNVNFGKG